MARRVLLLLLAAATLLGFVSSAQAASRTASVKVLECDSDAGSATFEGSIRAIRGSSQLAMRFTLQARSEDQPAWAAIKAPGFGSWLSARPGKTRYVYDKTVNALPAPGDYRVVVRYRWRDAGGDVLDREKKVSRVCSQDDPRPDLQPLDLTRSATGWVLTVANGGATTAAATPATLRVAGQLLTATSPTLPAGTEAKVLFTGPACAPGDVLVATVDPDDDVDEADEAGNVLTVPCPS